MATSASDAAPPPCTPPAWVWRSSEASIAAGQISLLALVETGLVLALYLWLAFHIDRPWWLLLSAVAAPILLLRSEASKAQGLELLYEYSGRDELTRQELILLFLLVTTITWVVTYGLAHTWLPGHTGWALIWRAASLVAVAVAFAGAFAVAVAAAAAGENLNSAGGKIATVVAALFPVAGAVLGVWIRSLCIRVYASLCHPIAGLRRLPHNWRETLAVVDFTHPPELLPGASQVHEVYTVAGWMARVRSKDATDQVLASLIIPCWYLPALLWRWSLKATLWLWWPLALLLRQPLDGVPADQARDQAAVRVYGLGRWLLGLALLVLLWISLSYWPYLQAWLNTLEDDWQKPLKYLLTFPPPPPRACAWGQWCSAASWPW
jgi:hypothetical protein